MKNEIVLFTDGDVNIEVQINPEQETVWLTQKQMEALFEVKHATDRKSTRLNSSHIQKSRMPSSA